MKKLFLIFTLFTILICISSFSWAFVDFNDDITSSDIISNNVVTNNNLSPYVQCIYNKFDQNNFSNLGSLYLNSFTDLKYIIAFRVNYNGTYYLNLYLSDTLPQGYGLESGYYSPLFNSCACFYQFPSSRSSCLFCFKV